MEPKARVSKRKHLGKYEKMVALHVARSEAVQARREYKARWQKLWRAIPENRISEQVQANLR